MFANKKWQIRNWGQFILSQAVHTVITLGILGALLLTARHAGALDGVLSPEAQTGGTSFTTINYQGRLADAAGHPVSDTVTLQFAIYDAATGGNLLWTETHANVPVSDGLFSVRLGSQTSGGLPLDVFSGGDVWLETTVEGETLTPREKLAAVPFAMMAGELDGDISGDLAVEGVLLASEIHSNGDNGVAQIKLRNNDAIEYRDLEQPGNFYFNADGGTGNGHILVGGIHLNGGNGGVAQINLQNNDAIEYRDSEQPGSFYFNADGGTGNAKIRVSQVIQGATIETQLMTPDELEGETIPRFSRGDLLCWDWEAGQLEMCAESLSPLVVAVADENGKPIVLGAEPVKVLGPVQPGDLLVASDVPGYAIAWSQVGEGSPPVGVVIAKALERFDGGQGMIKAMIMGR